MAFIISAAPDGSSPAPVPSFRPAFEACGCFVECGGSGERELPLQILLLLRQDHKTEPNVWGVPGGKLHLSQGETAEAAMVRELEEETGLTLAALEEPHLRPCGRVCVRYPEVDFVYHMYRARLINHHTPPAIRIDSREHKTHRWATLEEALGLPLVRGEIECIELAYPQHRHRHRHQHTHQHQGADPRPSPPPRPAPSEA